MLTCCSQNGGVGVGYGKPVLFSLLRQKFKSDTSVNAIALIVLTIKKVQQERKGAGGGYASSVKLNLTDPCRIVAWLRDARPQRAGSPIAYVREYNAESQNRAGKGSILFFKIFFCLRGSFPLYPKIFYFISQ